VLTVVRGGSTSAGAEGEGVGLPLSDGFADLLGEGGRDCSGEAVGLGGATDGVEVGVGLGVALADGRCAPRETSGDRSRLVGVRTG
jgi:hypothetical protein